MEQSEIEVDESDRHRRENAEQDRERQKKKEEETKVKLNKNRMTKRKDGIKRQNELECERGRNTESGVKRKSRGTQGRSRASHPPKLSHNARSLQKLIRSKQVSDVRHRHKVTET